jgi:Beta-lactamase superfamily domain
MLLKRGLAAKARAAGFHNVRELDAWEATMLGALTITGAPAKHKVPEITFVLEGLGLSVYFAADTLLIPELREVARRFPRIDLALVPVNGSSGWPWIPSAWPSSSGSRHRSRPLEVSACNLAPERARWVRPSTPHRAARRPGGAAGLASQRTLPATA